MNERQQVLRATNEEIRRVSADVNSDESEFVCEYGRKDCHELIRLTVEDSTPFAPRRTGPLSLLSPIAEH
jgi:hypothetical protein